MLRHRARETKPIEQFVMAAIFGLRQIGVTLGVPFSLPQGFEVTLVGLDIGVHPAVLFG